MIPRIVAASLSLVLFGCAGAPKQDVAPQFVFVPNAPVPSGELREQADQIVHIFRPTNDFVEIKPYETFALGTHLPFIVEQVRVRWTGADGRRHDVLFRIDSSSISTGQSNRLAAFVRRNARSIDSVLIEGRADSTGTAAHNLPLSARRADAVEAQLVTLGVPRDRIETRFFGDANPIATNSTPAGRQRNRSGRVIINP